MDSYSTTFGKNLERLTAIFSSGKHLNTSDIIYIISSIRNFFSCIVISMLNEISTIYGYGEMDGIYFFGVYTPFICLEIGFIGFIFLLFKC